MVKKEISEELEIPEKITVDQKGDVLTMTGSKGSVSRIFNTPNAKITVEGNKLVLHAKKGSRKEGAIVKAYKAHMKNMMFGVENGYVYMLKICSGHFPMNVSYNNGVFTIKNFIGEKVPRTFNVKTGAKVTVKGTEVIVEGIDKEVVSQTAASIEQLTRRPGFDKRIFQDGIYITSKAGKEIK
ncbi:MAG: 50S ribosomal protein L6 [Nanoarchaeota archaeon]|nr:50S ribosomal protein L6 [Nanoarchaeota archaeon]